MLFLWKHQNILVKSYNNSKTKVLALRLPIRVTIIETSISTTNYS